jgi:hypothetical protein
MTQRVRNLVATFLLAGTATALTVAATQNRDSVAAISVVSRETIDRMPSVLFDLPGRRIDQLLATLPNDRNVTAGHVPQGWTLNQQGRQVRLTGPAADDVAIRLDAPGGAVRDYAGRDVNLQVGLDGKLGRSERIQIRGLGPTRTTSNLDGILTLPPEGSPGSPILVGVTGDYRNGRWEFAGVNGAPFRAPLISPDAINQLEVLTGNFGAEYGGAVGGVLNIITKRPAPQPFAAVFPSSGTFTGVRHWDRFGVLDVDAPVNIAPVPLPSCQRGLTAASEYTFAGQAACVSGCFPTIESGYGLMLDGRTELSPWGLSGTTIMVGIPADTTAGPHTISVPGGSSSVTIGVLTLEGSLDQNRLWRGEATTMRLRVMGTEDRIPIRVVNQTPGVIAIDGGVAQVVTTAGGRDNSVTRSVKGIEKGNFTIVYSVNSAGCGKPQAR